MTQSKHVAWINLIVENTDEAREFYERVVGWESQPLSEDHADHNGVDMTADDGEIIASIIEQSDVDDNPPPQWLMHIAVDDLDASLLQVAKLGGEVLYQREHLAVIRDPAGAVCALVADAE